MTPSQTKTYEMSRSVFDSTLRDPKPGEKRSFWTDLQGKLSRWVNYEYGYQPAERMVLGLAEEFAELLESTDAAHRSDALGDLGIFLIQHCNNHRLDAGVLIESEEQVNPTWELPRWIGRLAHIELKYLHGIRGMRDELGLENREIVRRAVAEHATGIFQWLKKTSKLEAQAHPYRYTGPIDTAFEDIVRGVANEVMLRKKKLLPLVMGVTT